MRLYYNLLALFAFICTISAATVDYTKNGVLRIDDYKCNINFVNFGIGDTIKDIKVSFANKVLTIENLKNGNEGQNNDSFNKDDIVKYIIVTQGNVEKDYTVTKYKDGLFSISIKVNSCNEVTVKQTYKYDVLMYSYLLYANKIPNPINTSFPTDQFGPSSNDQPYDKLYWDMNKGLDELREKCRIYIDYRRREYGGSWHYVWYLSTETINKDNCSNADFYEIVRKHYPKYNTMYELFGDYYEGYVMKRESGSVAHMDGIINSKYIIEVYQEACGIQSDNQVICTISSEEKLKFDDFTDELMKNCLSIIVDKDEVGKWSANKSNVKAQFENYSIKVENNGEGTLPTSEDGVVGYKTFKANNSSGVARFKVSLVCNDGTYRDNKCRCKACSLGCKLCTGPDQCTECKHGNLTNGQCICDAGYFMNIDGNCQKCGDDCKTCKNAETCDSCIDPIKELKDGKCVCPANSTLKNGKCECDAGYFMNKEGKCSKCGVDCKTCKNAETCDSCIDPIKELKDGKCVCPANSTLKNGKCECDAGYFMNNDGKCSKCGVDCKTCKDAETCDSCIDPIKELKDGRCLCPANSTLKNGKCECDAGYFMNNDGKCSKCGVDCKTCKNAETCDSCIDPIKELKDGRCLCPANSTLKNGKCECDAGYFMNNDGKCSKCGVDCKTCKNAETCDSCIDPIKELKDGRCECPANSSLKNGKCECDAGYFMNNDGKCSKCGVDCKTCKDAETCDSCIDPIKELKDGRCECPANSSLKNGKCECDAGYFMNNDGKCSKCGDDCKTCSENAETCDSCIDPIKELKDGRCVCPANSTLKNGKCECDAGYFMNNDGKCSKCGDDCKTCSENAESCDSCYEPKVLNESEKKCECPPNSTLKEGKCECNDGFFMKEGNCEECGDDCETCKDAETCDSCFDPVKELKNGKCVCPANSTLKSGKCECDDGYFMNNDGKCSKCGNDCKTCSENAESCDSCYEPKILNESEKRCECPPNSTLKEGKCICDDGYYMDEGECKVCGPDCKTCENANTCTECANPKKKLNNGKCECKENHHMNNEGQCICDEGFYAENNECVACVGDCKTCKSATYCEKCHNELKIAVDGVCKCIDGYYMKEGKCEKCKPGCVKCTENECLECEGEGRVPGEDGQCVCGKSYYEDYETHECNSCGVSCATCNKKGKCTSCKDTRAFISDGVCVCKYSALNEDGYCIICDKSCAECDAHGCVTCADPTKTPDENGKC